MVRISFVLLGWGVGGVGVKAINLFKIGARRGLDVTAGALAPILKRLIAVNTFVSPWGLKILGWEIFVCMEESVSALQR